MGFMQLAVAPEVSHESLPLTHGPATLAGHVRLDNRDDLLGALAPGAEATTVPDSTLVLLAYLRWGTDCPAHLSGDFAFAIWDARDQSLFMARDHFGVQPMLHMLRGGRLLFSNEPGALIAMCGSPDGLTINERWVLSLFTEYALDRGETVYEEMLNLRPAEAMVFKRGAMRTWTYWEPDLGRTLAYRHDQDYVDECAHLLEEAVRVRVRTAHPVGVELSGGLDSSTMAALATRLLKADGRLPEVFSHIKHPHDTHEHSISEDEPEQIKAIAAHLGLPHVNWETGETRDLMETIALYTERHRVPLIGGVAPYNHVLYESAARKGVRVLLSGFGGDEGASMNTGGCLPEFAHTRQWARLWRECAGYASVKSGRSGPQMFAGFVLSQYAPALVGLKSRLLGRKSRREALAERKIASPALLASASAGGAKITDLLSSAHGLAEHHMVRLSYHESTRRLETSAIAARPLGVECRFPLFDRRLVEFFLAVPVDQKMRGGVGRHLFRRSIARILPEEIVWRQVKSGGAIPNAFWSILSAKHEVLKRVDAMRGNPRIAEYIDIARLQALVDAHHPGMKLDGNAPRLGWVTRALMFDEFMRQA
jgi:asparagine synthase (glutamine-hydrolysing)